MPKVLEQAQVDPIQEQVDQAMTEADEADFKRLGSGDTMPDLTDGGKVGLATLYPMKDGKQTEKGRAVARRGWMWNGTESLLMLKWNPNGTQHDGARSYLTKRQCMCCMQGGFRGYRCPNCVKNSCTKCRASTDRKKIIPLFYLRKEDVPYPARFYGSIDCFLEFCPRREGRGFKTEQEMRMHATMRHRMEYRAYQESQAAAHRDELESLRRRLDAMAGQRQRPAVRTPEEKQRDAERMAKARAARKPKAASGV